MVQLLDDKKKKGLQRLSEPMSRLTAKKRLVATNHDNTV